MKKETNKDMKKETNKDMKTRRATPFELLHHYSNI